MMLAASKGSGLFKEIDDGDDGRCGPSASGLRPTPVVVVAMLTQPGRIHPSPGCGWAIHVAVRLVAEKCGSVTAVEV